MPHKITNASGVMKIRESLAYLCAHQWNKYFFRNINRLKLLTDASEGSSVADSVGGAVIISDAIGLHTSSRQVAGVAEVSFLTHAHRLVVLYLAERVEATDR